MPTTYTTRLSLAKPEVGSSRDTWGALLNGDLDILDQFVFQAMPIGAMIDFGGPNAPSGWLICDGRTVSRTTFSALFAAIGTYWGAGDGTSTFALPSPNGRASIGPGTVVDTNGTSITYSFTQKTGAVTNVIAKVNLPNYNMVTDTQGSHSHGGATVSAGPWGVGTDAQGTHSHGGLTGVDDRDHVHSGATDTQGYHDHAAPTPGDNTNGAGSFHNSSGAPGYNGFRTDGAGNHAHNFTTGGRSTGHFHGIGADGNHAHNVTITAHAHGIVADGNHAHNVSLGGSGVAFSLLNPVIVVTKIIYAGNQAAVTVMGEIVPAAMASELAITDELATLRTELAELRAILMPPRSLRVMSSPSRGPH